MGTQRPNDDWKIEEFDRRTVESIDNLRDRMEKMELWAAGIRVKFAIFGTLFGAAGALIIQYLAKMLNLK